MVCDTHVVIITVVIVVVLVDFHARDAIHLNHGGGTVGKSLTIIHLLVDARFGRNGTAFIQKDSKVNGVSRRRAVWSNKVLLVLVVVALCVLFVCCWLFVR